MCLCLAGLCSGVVQRRCGVSLSQPWHGQGRLFGASCSGHMGQWIAGGPGQHLGHCQSVVAAVGIISPAHHVSYTTVYVPPSRTLHNLPNIGGHYAHHSTAHSLAKGPRFPCRTVRSLRTPLNAPLRNLHTLGRTTHSNKSHRNVHSRSLHTSHRKREKESLKPSSQVEVTVKDLKEKAKAAGTVDPVEKALSPVERKSLWVRFKEEVLHYYHGFRLLLIDTKIGCKYVWRVANGETLSRREYRQVK